MTVPLSWRPLARHPLASHEPYSPSSHLTPVFLLLLVVFAIDISVDLLVDSTSNLPYRYLNPGSITPVLIIFGIKTPNHISNYHEITTKQTDRNIL